MFLQFISKKKVMNKNVRKFLNPNEELKNLWKLLLFLNLLNIHVYNIWIHFKRITKVDKTL